MIFVILYEQKVNSGYIFYRLRMSAWGQLKGKMEGLCGDFNDDPSNDYMTPEGNIENATTTFVNSWKVDGYNTEGWVY